MSWCMWATYFFLILFSILFYFQINVAKFYLGEVKLESMWSAALPLFGMHKLRGWSSLGAPRSQVTLSAGPSVLQALGVTIIWVVLTFRIAMVTSLLCLHCIRPLLTFKAPVLKLIH